jgi:dihydroxy-acid dehydratase
VGGPIGLVRSGDRIRLDVPARRLDLLVEPAVLEARQAERPRREGPRRGYAWLYERAIQQAHLGADFDFLRHESLRDR